MFNSNGNTFETVLFLEVSVFYREYYLAIALTVKEEINPVPVSSSTVGFFSFMKKISLWRNDGGLFTVGFYINTLIPLISKPTHARFRKY